MPKTSPTAEQMRGELDTDDEQAPWPQEPEPTVRSQPRRVDPQADWNKMQAKIQTIRNMHRLLGRPVTLDDLSPALRSRMIDSFEAHDLAKEGVMSTEGLKPATRFLAPSPHGPSYTTR